MRNRFITGMFAGAALGALITMAMSPETRKPIMRGAGEMGKQMRKMWRSSADGGTKHAPRETF